MQLSNDVKSKLSYFVFSHILRYFDHFLNTHIQLFPNKHTMIYQYWAGIKSMRAALTHWGRVSHICVRNLTIIVSDNGLSPGWRYAIIWTNAGLLLIGPLGTNFSEILIEIQTSSFKKMHLKVWLQNGVHFAFASMCQFGLSTGTLWYVYWVICLSFPVRGLQWTYKWSVFLWLSCACVRF